MEDVALVADVVVMRSAVAARAVVVEPAATRAHLQWALLRRAARVDRRRAVARGARALYQQDAAAARIASGIAASPYRPER